MLLFASKNLSFPLNLLNQNAIIHNYVKTIKVIKTTSHLNDKLSAVVANSRKNQTVTFTNGYINQLNFLVNFTGRVEKMVKMIDKNSSIFELEYSSITLQGC